MRVLLVQPPVEDFYETEIRLQPIGLCYLKAALKKFLPEVETRIIDFHRGHRRGTIPLPKELSSLKEYHLGPDRSPFCGFHHYYRFGATEEDILRIFREAQADVIGVSSLFSPYFREAMKVAELAKQSGAITVIGGSHASAMPAETIRPEYVDYVIEGEGEKSFTRLISRLSGRESLALESIAGLWYKKDGAILSNPRGENFSPDELPIPDLSDFSPETYLFQGKPMSFIITSRSCPHRCSFCSVHTTFGTDYRRNSPTRVLEEIRTRYREGYRVFDFEDDNLTFYKKEFREILEGIIAKYGEEHLHLTAMNGISYISLDADLLRLMKRAGFRDLNLALVSSDRSVRETTKRPHTVEKYLEIVAEADRLGFHVTSYQILGLPGESLDSMMQTLAFQAEQPVLLGASPFYLTPSSPIAAGIAFSESDVFLSRLSAFHVRTAEFHRDDIYTLFLSTRILNFLKKLAADKNSFSEIFQKESVSGNSRDDLGVAILRRLFQERKLHAVHGENWRVLEHFRADLFFELLSRIRHITAPGGQRLSVEKDPLESALSPARI